MRGGQLGGWRCRKMPDSAEWRVYYPRRPGELLTSQNRPALALQGCAGQGARLHGCAFCGQSVGEGRTPQSLASAAVRSYQARQAINNNAAIAEADVCQRPPIRSPRVVQGVQLVEHGVGGGCGPAWCEPWPALASQHPPLSEDYLS